jgi:hypothetical protein
MRTLRSRQMRGQAAVEMALMTIIIIPTFLYIIFLDDLLRFKQDQQEAMIASGWDFTTMNWDHQTNNTADYYPSAGNSHHGAATQFNRFSYSDHTASTPRFEDPTASSEYHHLAVGAHQCWLVGGKANQVTCTQGDINMAANFAVDGTVNGRTRLRDWVANGTGGQYSCTGRVGVINNYLPDGILFFSKEELSSRKFHGKYSDDGAIDFNGTSAHSYTTASEAYHFPADTFSIVTHPWAMTDQDNVAPTDTPRLPGGTPGPALYDRVVQVYNAIGPLAAITSATIYPAKAVQQQLISPLILIDSPVGDLMLTPEVAFTKSYAPKVGGFYSSQYWDGQGDDVSKHYSNRENWYLGAKNQP